MPELTYHEGSELLRLISVALFVILSLLASACQRQSTVCPEDSITYFADASSLPANFTPANSETIPTPALVEIKGRMTEVDRVVEGPICSDTWKGTIYVSCNIQIEAWDDAPLFFENCPLIIEPQAKIYVASHNDTAYYRGCSCHTGELGTP